MRLIALQALIHGAYALPAAQSSASCPHDSFYTSLSRDGQQFCSALLNTNCDGYATPTQFATYPATQISSYCHCVMTSCSWEATSTGFSTTPTKTGSESVTVTATSALDSESSSLSGTPSSTYSASITQSTSEETETTWPTSTSSSDGDDGSTDSTITATDSSSSARTSATETLSDPGGDSASLSSTETTSFWVSTTQSNTASESTQDSSTDTGSVTGKVTETDSDTVTATDTDTIPITTSSSSSSFSITSSTKGDTESSSSQTTTSNNWFTSGSSDGEPSPTSITSSITATATDNITSSTITGTEAFPSSTVTGTESSPSESDVSTSTSGTSTDSGSTSTSEGLSTTTSSRTRSRTTTWGTGQVSPVVSLSTAESSASSTLTVTKPTISLSTTSGRGTTSSTFTGWNSTSTETFWETATGTGTGIGTGTGTGIGTVSDPSTVSTGVTLSSSKSSFTGSGSITSASSRSSFTGSGSVTASSSSSSSTETGSSAVSSSRTSFAGSGSVSSTSSRSSFAGTGSVTSSSSSSSSTGSFTESSSRTSFAETGSVSSSSESTSSESESSSFTSSASSPTGSESVSLTSYESSFFTFSSSASSFSESHSASTPTETSKTWSVSSTATTESSQTWGVSSTATTSTSTTSPAFLTPSGFDTSTLSHTSDATRTTHASFPAANFTQVTRTANIVKETCYQMPKPTGSTRRALLHNGNLRERNASIPFPYIESVDFMPDGIDPIYLTLRDAAEGTHYIDVSNHSYVAIVDSLYNAMVLDSRGIHFSTKNCRYDVSITIDKMYAQLAKLSGQVCSASTKLKIGDSTFLQTLYLRDQCNNTVRRSVRKWPLLKVGDTECNTIEVEEATGQWVFDCSFPGSDSGIQRCQRAVRNDVEKFLFTDPFGGSCPDLSTVITTLERTGQDFINPNSLRAELYKQGLDSAQKAEADLSVIYYEQLWEILKQAFSKLRTDTSGRLSAISEYLDVYNQYRNFEDDVCEDIHAGDLPLTMSFRGGVTVIDSLAKLNWAPQNPKPYNVTIQDPSQQACCAHGATSVTDEGSRTCAYPGSARIGSSGCICGTTASGGSIAFEYTECENFVSQCETDKDCRKAGHTSFVCLVGSCCGGGVCVDPYECSQNGTSLVRSSF